MRERERERERVRGTKFISNELISKVKSTCDSLGREKRSRDIFKILKRVRTNSVKNTKEAAPL